MAFRRRIPLTRKLNLQLLEIPRVSIQSTPADKKANKGAEQRGHAHKRWNERSFGRAQYASSDTVDK